MKFKKQDSLTYLPLRQLTLSDHLLCPNPGSYPSLRSQDRIYKMQTQWNFGGSSLQFILNTKTSRSLFWPHNFSWPRSHSVCSTDPTFSIPPSVGGPGQDVNVPGLFLTKEFEIHDSRSYWRGIRIGIINLGNLVCRVPLLGSLFDIKFSLRDPEGVQMFVSSPLLGWFFWPFSH